MATAFILTKSLAPHKGRKPLFAFLHFKAILPSSPENPDMGRLIKGGDLVWANKAQIKWKVFWKGTRILPSGSQLAN